MDLGLARVGPGGEALAPASEAAVLGVGRSFSGRRWVWRQGEERIAFGIAQRLGVPEIVGRLLAARGLDLETAADFLVPTLRALLPDPSVLADMDACAERIAASVWRQETVAVFGDYDVDGACSSALMVLLLRQLGCTVLPYVPDRMNEGYGPNAPALKGLVAQGATLVICVDCGTAAAAALGAIAGAADVVVLDHHKAEGPPPAVVATVNPNRLDCGSGLHHLCAAAVAFMAGVATLRALRRTGFFQKREEPDLLGLLDLVALATICDVMPLTGINRALVAQGLRVMGRRERPGIAALLEVAARREAPDAVTCGFGLGPRINAAGRISESDLGLRLLLCTDPVEAQRLATTLDQVNRLRQQVEAAMLDGAMEAAAAQAELGHATLMVSGEDWHPGVVGIVAGRIKERFNRPTCVGGMVEGRVRGSGRSVPGADLGAAVIAARQCGILSTGGGHPMAAGFSLDGGRLAEFHAFLDERLSHAARFPSAADLRVEATLAVPGATSALASEIMRLAPFGNGNEEPVMVLPNARVVRSDRLGREATTIRAYLEGEGGGPRLKALLFRARPGPLADALATPGAPLHLAGHLRLESWNGNTTVGFVVTDAAAA